MPEPTLAEKMEPVVDALNEAAASIRKMGYFVVSHLEDAAEKPKPAWAKFNEPNRKKNRRRK